MLFYVLFVFVLFYVLFVCKCALYYCHQVLTQLHLTNVSYHRQMKAPRFGRVYTRSPTSHFRKNKTIFDYIWQPWTSTLESVRRI